MIHKLRVPDEIADLIKKFHPLIKRKVKSALKLILNDPTSGTLLKEYLKGIRSYRMGRIRIIYRMSSGKYLEIIAIGPRKTIYE